ncbi:MAG: rhomboid family intramembrane serine protease [Gammaproteobacteria bacterium]|nr:rhomboid family intramembrane serine protease [Gammaproteobacteria bacterium]
MFPIRDDNPQLVTPFATLTLVALNVAAWILLQGMGTGEALAGSICRFGLIPGELMQQVPPGTRLPLGPATVCVLGETGNWITTITSMFMHGGWLHLIGNMWFLWIFGGNVEDAMGPARFVTFYLLCGVAAGAFQIAADPSSQVPMVGASGAIGGVLGAYILLYPRVHVHLLFILVFYVTTIAVPAYLMLGYWFAVQVLSGVLSYGSEGGGVAFWAHVGGFVAGAVLVFLFRDKTLLGRHPYHGWRQQPAPTRSWHRVGRDRDGR